MQQEPEHLRLVLPALLEAVEVRVLAAFPVGHGLLGAEEDPVVDIDVSGRDRLPAQQGLGLGGVRQQEGAQEEGRGLHRLGLR
jgi:hypothetical protein